MKPPNLYNGNIYKVASYDPLHIYDSLLDETMLEMTYAQCCLSLCIERWIDGTLSVTFQSFVIYGALEHNQIIKYRVRCQRCYPLTRDHSRAVDAFSSTGHLFTSWKPRVIMMPTAGHSRSAPSQWETALLCNELSHWLGAILESVLHLYSRCWHRRLLTHWGRVTHICFVKLTIIGSDNGLSPGRRQAIIWTNAGILLIGPLGTNFIEILIGIQTFSFRKMHLKMLSAKWRPFCLGLNVLTSAGEDSEDGVDIVTTFDFQSSTVRRPWADSI